MYGTNGKHVDLPEAAAGIGGTGRGFTCVSLKSLTPTQYTMAPRDLAFSACWRKTRNGSMTSEILEHLKLRRRQLRKSSVKRLPLAARWWAGAPAALHPLRQWSRWPGLEETYLPVSATINHSPRVQTNVVLPKFSCWICSFAWK